MSEGTHRGLSVETNDCAGKLLLQLHSLIRLVALYELSNDVFSRPLDEFQNHQHDLITREGKVEFRFFENEVFFNTQRMRLAPEARKMMQTMIHDFRAAGLGGFSLTEVLVPNHAKIVVEEVGKYLHQKTTHYEILNTQLAQRGISEIQFFAYRAYSEKQNLTIDSQQYLHLNALRKYVLLKREMEQLIPIPPGSNPAVFVDTLRKAQRGVQNLVDELMAEPQGVQALIHCRHYSQPMIEQALQVCVLSICLGKDLNLTKTELGDLGMSALFYHRPHWLLHQDLKGWTPYLHLIGMAADGGLNPSIYRRILVGFHQGLSADGKRGIPHLREPRVPDLLTRIVSLCAYFNLLITPMSQQIGGAGLTPHHALRYLLLSTPPHLDRALVKILVNCLGIYPVGTVVRLKDGQLAMVIDRPQDVTQVHKPLVKILAPIGAPLIPDGEQAIDHAVPALGLDINVPYYLFFRPKAAVRDENGR